jgi:hypothetical protein
MAMFSSSIGTSSLVMSDLITIKPLNVIASVNNPPHEYGHTLRIELVVDFMKVVARTHCNECCTLLHEQVIYEVPKSIIEEKCLPACVNGKK